MSQFSYHDYVSDDIFQTRYLEYQKKYAVRMRESDKVLINMIADILLKHYSSKTVSLLDIGCSNGNFLRHVKKAFPEMLLTGGDAAPKAVQCCLDDQSLEGICFELMDILNMDGSQQFDIITANAVLYMFNDREYEQAVKSIFRCLVPGGFLLVFDFCHPFRQEIKIIETSSSHPHGLALHFRSLYSVRAVLSRNGFEDIVYTPFSIPVDLEKGNAYLPDAHGFEDLNSYTIKTETGERLIFRGALYQPWCHLTARKKAAQ
ncbi:MAG: class I SAM-dependent methyltransferase [Desulfobacterota bacterium]|nr:class I SAM-dependent methyltransferase [Thermodesulfobacteriota bacterium]